MYSQFYSECDFFGFIFEKENIMIAYSELRGTKIADKGHSGRKEQKSIKVYSCPTYPISHCGHQN